MKNGKDLRAIKRLKPEEAKWTPDLNLIPATTKAVKPLGNEIVGQERGIAGITFGARIKKPNYHVVVIGDPGTGRKTTIRKKLAELTAREKCAFDDYCYVHDRDNPKKLIPLKVKAGFGPKLKKDVDRLINDFKEAIPRQFGSEEYFDKIKLIQDPIDDKIDAVSEELNKTAEKMGFKIELQESLTQTGVIIRDYVILYVHNGEEKDSEAVDQMLDSGELAKGDHDRIVADRRQLGDAIKKTQIASFKLEGEKKQLTKNSDKEYFLSLAKQAFPLKDYKSEAEIKKFIKWMLESMSDNVVELFFRRADHLTGEYALNEPETDKFLKYRVYPLTNNKNRTRPPVVFEENLAYLFGRITSHVNVATGTITSLTATGGSLLKADKGYLVLYLRDFLKEDIMLWEKLRRLLTTNKLYPENYFSSALMPVTEFKTEPIDIDVKIILIADYEVFDIIRDYDKTFSEIFRVISLFDDEMKNNEANILKMVRFIKTVVAHEKLLDFQKDAIVKIIEKSARLADGRQLSTRFSELNDLIIQADYWAREDKAKYVAGKHVEKAIAEKRYRLGLTEDRYLSDVANGKIAISTRGLGEPGQVNALVVSIDISEFGHPMRVTFAAGVGVNGIIDNEAEANMSGNIHTKGIAINRGFFHKRFAQKTTLCANASLTLEQSYCGVDGDSASSTEIYAGLTFFSGLRPDQGIGITGSVNQNGEIQVIGGVNEKIEGFFDCCLATGGLTGEQGVIIPETNKDDLMLRDDVIQAIREGKFHIYPVRTIEEGIEILTGVKAWESPDNYGQKTVYGLTLKKLEEYAAICNGENEPPRKCRKT
ncbi:MAG: ATP-binding protein [Candidatus Falkowbacteria bacterium]